jgi:hypothetical protein
MYLYAPRNFFLPNALTCRIYYDTCSSDIIGYVQSATNVCFYSNSGTSTPYEYVLQNSKKGNCFVMLGEKSVNLLTCCFETGEFTTFQYPTLAACNEDRMAHSEASSEVTLVEQSCIL